MVRKFGKYFLGWLDLNRDLGVFKTIKIRDNLDGMMNK